MGSKVRASSVKSIFQSVLVKELCRTIHYRSVQNHEP